MRIVTLKEVLTLVEEHDKHDVHRLFDDADEILAHEEDDRLRAVLSVRREEHDVHLGNMLLLYYSEDEALSEFVRFAQKQYAGKRLHVSVCSEAPICYDVLRFFDFTVDEVTNEVDDDENEIECITCSKQL